MIGQNTITYTTSMESFFYAAAARKTDRWTDEPSTPLPGVFGNTLSEQPRETVEHLAAILNVRPNTGVNITKGAFMTEFVKDTDLLHYHAHAAAKNGEVCGASCSILRRMSRGGRYPRYPKKPKLACNQS